MKEDVKEVKEQIRIKIGICRGLIAIAAYDFDPEDIDELLCDVLALLGEPEEELNWYEVSDGVTRETTDDWHTAVEAVVEWHHYLLDEAPDKEFPEPKEIFKYVLQGPPDIERLNALIEAWEKELTNCYGYVSFPVRVKRISEIDAWSVPR